MQGHQAPGIAQVRQGENALHNTGGGSGGRALFFSSATTTLMSSPLAVGLGQILDTRRRRDHQQPRQVGPHLIPQQQRHGLLGVPIPASGSSQR